MRDNMDSKLYDNSNQKIRTLEKKNEKLKQELNKAKRLLSLRIPVKDVHLLLNMSIPNFEEDDSDIVSSYDFFLQSFYPEITYTNFIRVLHTLLKLGREDLVTLFQKRFMNEDSLIHGDEELFEKVFSLFTRDVVKSRYNASQIDIKQLYFKTILFYVITRYKRAMFKVIDKYIQEFSLSLLQTKDEETILNVIKCICLEDRALGYNICDVFYNHWVQTLKIITEDKIHVWKFISNESKHQKLSQRLRAMEDNDKFVYDGYSYFRDSFDNPYANKSKSTPNWKTTSFLKRFGYEITNKTDIERRAALRTALKFHRLIDIINFIEWRLDMSISLHEKGHGDYSYSISKYESDLEFLKNISRLRKIDK